MLTIEGIEVEQSFGNGCAADRAAKLLTQIVGPDHSAGDDAIVEVSHGGEGIGGGKGAGASEVKEAAMAIIGAAARDGGDDAAGGVAVECGVVLAGDAELADGGLGKGVGHAGMAAGTISCGEAARGSRRAAAFGFVFDFGAGLLPAAARHAAVALVVVDAVDAGTVGGWGKAAEAEQV